MPNKHPTTDQLAEYNAGSMTWAQALCVSVHLHYCPRCRQQNQALSQVGGEIFAAGASKEVSDDLLESVLSHLPTVRDTEKPVKPTPMRSSRPNNNGLPKLVNDMISATGRLRWQRVTPSLKAARLKSGQQQYEVALHKINAGGQVAEHDHRATEITVVLQGSFSDGDGIYSEGDFLVREPGEVHHPLAAQNEDCLCFSAQARPIKLTGFFARWLNPFLRIQPM